MKQRVHYLHRFVSLAVLLLGTLSGRGQNWIQWKTSDGGNGHYYALTLAETNWDAAEALADSWGGTLAIINSAAEQEFINRTFLTGTLEHRPVWIGLVDTASRRGPRRIKLGPVKVEIGDEPKQKFEWVTGEAMKYTNWHSGQPDNFPPGEHYGVINWFYSDGPPRGAKGDWNDAPLNGTTGWGGTTTGPYFGLMERDYDPSLPVIRKKKLNPIFICVAAVALVVVIIAAAIRRFRRRRRS